MKSSLLSTALIVLFTGSVAHGGQNSVSKSVSSSVTNAEVNLPVGSLKVVGVDSSSLGAEVKAKCENNKKKCLDSLEKLELVVKEEGSSVEISLLNWPEDEGFGLTADLILKVPQSLVLHANVGVGSAKVENMLKDIDLDIGVGEATIRIPTKDPKSVSLDSGIGQVTVAPALTGARRSGFVGGSYRWEGESGSQSIEATVGVGEVSVKLGAK